MILRDAQQLLKGIYDLQIAHDVYDFLVTDRNMLPPLAQSHPTEEELIIAPHSDCVGVSLYLDPALLQRLQHANPIEELNSGNVADWWTALEGVSHFVYFAWNAAFDKSVSLLELELQAEIDKYIASFWLLKQQSPQHFPHELMRILFERTRIDSELAGERADLYREASHYAQKFCRHLAGVLRAARDEPRSQQAVLAELRRVYRLSDLRKRAHIEDCA